MKKLTERQLKRLVVTPDDDLTNSFRGFTRQELRKLKRQFRKKYAPEIQIEEDRERRRKESEARRMQALYRQQQKELESLKRQIEAYEKVSREARPGTAATIAPEHKSEPERTFIALASDWHCEEIVDPKAVSGLNGYNPQIFRQRAERYFARIADEIEKERHSAKVSHLVLGLLGDFFSGSIHEELAETNALPPADAQLLAQGTILDGIAYLTDRVGNLKITAVCCSGNHGRMTEKRRIKNERGNSLEFLMYVNMSKILESNPAVRFLIADGYHVFVDVYGMTMRFHHGHAMRYKGGVGGLTIPVNKKINEWNKARHAYMDFFGHFHQFFGAPNFVCNGSLIGYNEFAIDIGAAYEPPQQALCVIGKEHGLRSATRIRVDS